MDLPSNPNPQQGEIDSPQSKVDFLNPTLVNEIANMVYSMFLHDLKIEEERLRINKQNPKIKWRSIG